MEGRPRLAFGESVLSSGKRPSPAEHPDPDRSRPLRRARLVLSWLIFLLPTVLGFAVFSSEYLLLPVSSVLAFYHRHAWLIDRTGIGTVYHMTGNPLYLYYAVYTASLPAILFASTAVMVVKMLRTRSEYVDVTRPDKGTLATTIFFTLGAGILFFTGPAPYLGIWVERYGYLRFSPDLYGAFLFAVLLWLPSMGWSRLLAAAVGRARQLVDHLLRRRDSRRRERDRIRRREAARRDRLQSHGKTIETPNRD